MNRAEPDRPRAPDAAESPARTLIRVLRRSRWIVLTIVLLAPLGALVASLIQEKQYSANAEVLLNRDGDSLAADITGAQGASPRDPEREAQTQAQLARVPPITERVLAENDLEGIDRTTFLANSSVTPKGDTDILSFTYTDADPQRARLLATEYARHYTAYRSDLDTGGIAEARRAVAARLEALERAGNQDSALYSDFLEREQQLLTLETLQSSNASLVKEADETRVVAPRPLRNTVLGFLLGIVGAVSVAFLRNALDTRVTTSEEIAGLLGVPLLARLPEPLKRLRERDRLVMVDEPTSAQAEPFRMLRMNLDFVTIDQSIRALVVTSALDSEGKSTTVANLAASLTRAGRRVILVDLDLRRPYIAKFFDREGAPGLTDVVLGKASLTDALFEFELPEAQAAGGTPPSEQLEPIEFEIPEAQAAGGPSNEEIEPIELEIPEARASAAGSASNDLSEPIEEVLWVLPVGTKPPNPGAFIDAEPVTRLLDQLRDRCDILLIDSPPALRVGDAISLSRRIDGVVVVSRLGEASRPALKELRRLLDASSARVLGVVATGANLEEGYAPGYYYGKAYEPPEVASRP